MFDTEVDQRQFYDIDRGHKKTLATSVITSPLKYSVLRSTAPRFAEARTQSVPFGVYNQDCAHKKTLESVSRDTRRFYASSFQSNQSRFDRPWSSPASDAIYDISRTNNSRPATVAHSLDNTSRTYAILRSKYARFGNMLRSEGPDVMYDLDSSYKMTMYTAMLRSPIHYKNVGVHTTERAHSKVQQQGDPKIGPGYYDAKPAKDVSVSPWLDNRPLSSLMSASPRFPGKRGTTSLGSTYSQERDKKAWAAKGFHMNKAVYLRPQYLPKAYLLQAKAAAQDKASK